jgi:hypothetical protein
LIIQARVIVESRMCHLAYRHPRVQSPAGATPRRCGAAIRVLRRDRLGGLLYEYALSHDVTEFSAPTWFRRPDLVLHPHLEARFLDTLACRGLRRRLPRLELAAREHPPRTNVDGLLDVYSLITERLADNGPAGALLGVARLVFPDMLVEIEATALVS